jgi:hypothetical protein
MLENRVLAGVGLGLLLGAFLLVAAILPPLLLPLLLVSTLISYAASTSLARRLLSERPIRGSRFRLLLRGPPLL